MIPYTPESYRLMHDGALALAQVEANGIRIDEAYLKNTIAETESTIKELQHELKKSPIMKLWKDHYKGRTKLGSTEQLGYVLFELMKYPCPYFTASGRFQCDEKSLSQVDDPFVHDYLKIKKLQKMHTTYLCGIEKEIVDGFIHPFFNLHLARTFRSSSDSPNFQNIPVRDPEIGKIIRQAFIPRDGGRIVELDYSGIEVSIAACYHQDPTMFTYLEDSTKDMHRDMAMECFKLRAGDVTKTIRYCGKNMFVFPQFYGDWFPACAKNLWDAMDSLNLCKADGTPVKAHLRELGIRKLGRLENGKAEPGTFTHHIQKVENHFWNERFPVYTQWKMNWFKEYQKKGWLLTKTGFICQGFMRRNEIINYPIQGSAFHCLLWALIRLQNELIKRGMRSKIIGQIHDSIVADVPDDELGNFLGLAQHIMITELKRHWKWIIVPMKIEAEVTPINGNWYQKKERKI